MRLLIVPLVSLLLVSFTVFAQKISLEKKNITLAEALKSIRLQSGYNVLYDEDLISKAQHVSVSLKNATLEEALNQCFSNQPFTYTINKRTILITPRRNTAPPAIRQITGKVMDEKEQPLPGVTVSSKDGNTSTMTQDDGGYVISLPDAEKLLVFTYVGYVPQEIPVSESKVINVTLKLQPTGLQDVVVVGYGQQKKVSLIGAISTVKAEELKQPVANMTSLMAGRIAGIVGVQRSGQPGYDNADIYIRGISTFTNSKPLVLVDGVERDFGNVDPEDIASFSILKDASATAVYGVRGANGVIIIQTKQGKVSKPMINAQYDQGFTQFTKIPEFADGPTYMRIANEAYHNSQPNDPLPMYSEERIQKTASGEDPDLYPNVNWFDALFKQFGQNRRARVNASGGVEKAQYYLSLGYYDETGLYKTDELAAYNSAIKYTRYNFTSNLGLKVTPTTKVDFGAAGWISNGNYPGASAGDIWSAAYLLPPILIPPVYSNGLNAQIRTADVFNPYNRLTQSGYVTEFRSQLWSNIRITQQLDAFLKGLSATAMYSFDNYNNHTISRTKTVDGYMATGRDANGNLIMEKTSIGSNFLGYDRQNGGSRQYYTEAAVNYSNKFGKSNVSGLVLFNASDRQDAFAGSFISSIPFRYVGLAGRGTYAWDGKYMAEANFGYNGSETFTPKKQFGFFPSYGAGWVVSEEKFFEPLSNIFQFFKVRYSYGLVGNSNIGGRRFAYISEVGGGNGGYSYGSNNTNRTINGLDIGEYAVDVTWEKAKKQNLGIEFKTWANALSLTVDIFREDRTGIFRQRGDMPNYLGVRSLPWANLGEIHNRGIDATVDLTKPVGKDWQLNFRGNFTWARAKVIDDANAPWPYPWQQRIGKNFGQRFGYIALGLFESDKDVANSPYQPGINKAGDIKYKDLNGDGKIDTYDQAPIGYGSFPEIVYGFGPTVTYKAFTVAAWFKGISHVNIGLGGDGFQPFSQGGERGNLIKQVTDRWTPDNPNPRPFYPRLTYGNENMNYASSNWWLRDGSFLRLQTVQLNYDFTNKNWLKYVGMSNLSVYFIGYNLWTLSSFDLWDVEMGDGKGAQYPLTKTFNFGIKCSFK
ncbi:MAG: TonB-dependent receptor [Candidatus Pseudobacter hemicellulosilyticus]|uniref:TonB-dependent receptor n=1 Tax=Candidatus Pseudobacter hemicellulosilyticus TaxID=3121375 RepID=A0AAJ5WW47_9BACT|nr:MAG: TonB-dependent receptor [Pseudobacter sp.]